MIQNQHPPELKPFNLSGIVYSPDKPLAIINGKALTIGDKIKEAEIAQINEEEVELSLHEQTIILTLD